MRRLRLTKEDIQAITATAPKAVVELLEKAFEKQAKKEVKAKKKSASRRKRVILSFSDKRLGFSIEKLSRELQLQLSPLRGRWLTPQQVIQYRRHGLDIQELMPIYGKTPASFGISNSLPNEGYIISQVPSVDRIICRYMRGRCLFSGEHLSPKERLVKNFWKRFLTLSGQKERCIFSGVLLSNGNRAFVHGFGYCHKDVAKIFKGEGFDAFLLKEELV